MLCPNCETENADGARFCDECGFPLSGSIARAGGAASPSRIDESQERPRQAQRPRPRARQADKTVSEWPDAFENRRTSAWGSGSGATRDADFFDDERNEIVIDDDFFLDDVDGGFVEGTVSLDDSSRKDEQASGAFEPAFESSGAFEPAFEDSYESQSEFDDFFSDEDPMIAEEGSEEPFIEDTLDFGDDFFREDSNSTAQIPRIDQERKRQGVSFRADTRKSGMGNGKVAIVVVGALVVLAAIVAIVGFVFGVWGGKSVPDVTGMTEADARSVLEDEGFTVRTTQVKSDETEGLVLIMDPGAGSHAPEGSEVIIHIATARFIPDIQGKTADEARGLLDDAGYENVKYEAEYTDGEENIVMSVTPEAGTRAKSSMEVVVKVSENYKVPDISGKDLDGAIETMEDAGLYANVEYIDSDQYADGTIIGTTPEAGTKVSQGDYVTITVTRTRGVELVALTEELFSEGSTLTIDGVNWQVDSVMSVSYQGDDTVSYTATATPIVSVRGQTLVGSQETIDGTVVWSDDNEVISIG